MKTKPFRNEPFTDFSRPANRRLMEKALVKVERELGREHPIVIGGKKIQTQDKLRSICPADPSRTAGIFQKADAALARQAVEAAYRVFQDWRFEKPARRAAILFRMASIMRRRKFELAAWMVFEVGKAWPEADGDVAQAIDFCEFYGREALRYAGEQPLVRCPDEANQLVYIPLGVGVVIPPWNFPFAILTGMTTASLVCGNTVCLKPSSDSPATAAQFFKIAEEAGLPAGVLNFVTGSGGIAGEAMVEHPKTRFVAFTGSKQVGLRINQTAARQAPGQIWIKRVTLEMGGKDAIVVDAETDLDEAAAGVVAAAYGFQGQKCSACSRAIVVADIYEEFIARLIPRVEAIKVGPTTSPDNNMGPVINEGALKSILDYIEIGRREGRLLTGGARLEREGFFIKPTVIADVRPDATIAQEEVFGPVLAVIKARDYYHALEIANNTQYGLTGAVYTRNRTKINLAEQVFHVGNLFINRKCSGVLVGVHPLGGFNLSGTDSKAGGRDYLLLFCQAKLISEKTRRRR
jgi:1-pyrroline-5-carboxylate dehydrogenase